MFTFFFFHNQKKKKKETRKVKSTNFIITFHVLFREKVYRERNVSTTNREDFSSRQRSIL